MSRVYFLQAGPSGPIKIGFTRGDVHRRVAELQPGCPFPITEIGSKSGSITHEQWLHRRFASERMAGEWFTPTQPLLDAIIEILRPSYCWPETFSVADPFHPVHQAFLDEIDQFLIRSDMTATAFGRASVNDGNFVGDLRSGRMLNLRMIDHVRAFMQSRTKETAA